MRPKDEHTTPSRATRDEEDREAAAEHGVSDESTRGDQATPPSDVDEEVAERYREMTDRGANTPGEGRLP